MMMLIKNADAVCEPWAIRRDALRFHLARWMMGVTLTVVSVFPALAQEVIRWGAGATSTTYIQSLVGSVAPEVYLKHGVKFDMIDFRGNSANCVLSPLISMLTPTSAPTNSASDRSSARASIFELTTSSRQRAARAIGRIRSHCKQTRSAITSKSPVR